MEPNRETAVPTMTYLKCSAVRLGRPPKPRAGKCAGSDHHPPRRRPLSLLLFLSRTNRTVEHSSGSACGTGGSSVPLRRPQVELAERGGGSACSSRTRAGQRLGGANRGRRLGLDTGDRTKTPASLKLGVE